MRTAISGASLCFCLSTLPTAAFGADWAVNSTLSETVELNTNQFLRSPPAGGTLGSYTTITTNAEARTPTSRFNFDGDITYQKYWGPGIEGLPSEFRQDGVKARYETTGKSPRDLSYVELGWRESSTALAILSTLGVATNAQGFLDTSTIKGGIERDLSPLDFATVSARSTYTNFDPPGGGTPFTDSAGLGTWRHRLNSIVALTASSEIESVNFANSSNLTFMILREMAGVDATLSPVLNFRGMAGIGYVKADHTAAAVPPPPLIASGPSGSLAVFIADMLMSYRALKDTTVTLSGTRTIGPNVLGALTELTTIGAGLTQVINDRSSLIFGAYGSQQITESTVNFYSGSVTYSYQLAREWNTQITYRHLHRTASTPTLNPIFNPVNGIPVISGIGPANSDSLTFVLSRSFTVLPHGN